MDWTVNIQPEIRTDLSNIAEYVRTETGDADSAKKIVDNILSAIATLDTFPLTHRLHPDCEAEGIRYVTAGSYVVFFHADTSTHTVTVLRVLHRYQNTLANL